MKKKIAALFLNVMLVALCSSVKAQQPKKIFRLGYLSYGSLEIDKSLLAALQQGLRQLGYAEGKNIVIEQRYAGGQSEKLHELAAELVRSAVDVIVVAGDP